MKRSFLFLVVAVAVSGVASSAERHVPLTAAVQELPTPLTKQTHRFQWVSLVEKDGKAEAKDYASIVCVTSPENEKLRFDDTITLGASSGGTVFQRTLIIPTNSWLQPRQVTLDIVNGAQKLRQLTFTNGTAMVVDFSGTTNVETWAFPDGILTFNALLRLAPLLPREAGAIYTFAAYAEPVLFRVREAGKSEPPFTLACQGPEAITIGGKSLECVRFRLELKSASVQTDIWVASNKVVRFRETLPARAGAKFLEATLQQ